MSSSLYNFFEKKVIRYSLPFSFCYMSCFSNVKLNVFVSISKGLFGFVIVNIGLLIILCLIWSKVSYCFYIYLKILSFFISFVKDIVNRLNLLTKMLIEIDEFKKSSDFFNIYKLQSIFYYFNLLVVYFDRS